VDLGGAPRHWCRRDGPAARLDPHSRVARLAAAGQPGHVERDGAGRRRTRGPRRARHRPEHRRRPAAPRVGGVDGLPRPGRGHQDHGRRHAPDVPARPRTGSHRLTMHAGTVAAMLAARAEDAHPGLLFGDDTWSWAEVVRASAERAALASGLRGDGPFHIGVLLDNGPEYLFWLGGAALAGAAIVGINPTRRGAELARDIAHTDCQLIVTDATGKATLDELDLGLADARILVVDDPGYEKQLASVTGAPLPEPGPEP